MKFDSVKESLKDADEIEMAIWYSNISSGGIKKKVASKVQDI